MRRDRAYRWAAAGYGAAALAWLALWALTGDRLWWMAILNRGPEWLLAPAALLALPAALRPQRRWRQALPLLAAPLAVAPALGPLLLPDPPQPAGARSLRVMTFNVRYSNPDADAIARAIRAADPDVVALQEVQPATMAALVERLGAGYPHHIMATEHPYGAPALFSRLPMRGARVVELQADRSGLAARVEVGGEEVTVLAAHLLSYGLHWVAPADLPRTIELRVFEQERQARLLVEAAGPPGGPAVLACDCNSPEAAGASRVISAAFRSASREAGWWPGRALPPGAEPDVDPAHIDYVFFRGPLRAAAAYRMRDWGGSDHQPVVADLTW